MLVSSRRPQVLPNRAIATKLRQCYSIKRFVTAINTLSSGRAGVMSITCRRPSSSYGTPSASSTNTRSGREEGLERDNPRPKSPAGVGARVRMSACTATSAYLRGVVRAL